MALGWRGQYYRYKGFFLNILSLYKQRADLRAFTEVILSVSTITIFLLFALKPTALTIIALAKEINEKKETVAALDQKISNLKSASAIYSQNEEAISNLDVAIANKPQPDTISKQIEGLASKNSVTILGLSIGEVALVGKAPPTKKSSELKPLPEDAKEIPVSVNLQGNFPSLSAFIKDLENLRIVAKMDRTGITSSETGGQRVIVALISARVPYLENILTKNEKK